MLKTVKLYDNKGSLIKQLELPADFNYPPSVIFYGARAFLTLLPSHAIYTECSCWRAAEVEESVAVAK